MPTSDQQDQRPHREPELAQALLELARELRESREERARGLVTKCDLQDAEDRIVEAILSHGITAEDQGLLDALEQRQEAIVKKLEKLDTSTPPTPATS